MVGSIPFLEAVAVVAGFYDVAAMGESIKQGGRHFGIAERQIRGYDKGDELIELAEQAERQRSTVAGERQVTELNDGNTSGGIGECFLSTQWPIEAF